MWQFQYFQEIVPVTFTKRLLGPRTACDRAGHRMDFATPPFRLCLHHRKISYGVLVLRTTSYSSTVLGRVYWCM